MAETHRPVHAALVNPLDRMLEHITDRDATGSLYRGVEALLVALDEGEETGIDAAVEAILMGWLVRKRGREGMKMDW